MGSWLTGLTTKKWLQSASKSPFLSVIWHPAQCKGASKGAGKGSLIFSDWKLSILPALGLITIKFLEREGYAVGGGRQLGVDGKFSRVELGKGSQREKGNKYQCKGVRKALLLDVSRGRLFFVFFFPFFFLARIVYIMCTFLCPFQGFINTFLFIAYQKKLRKKNRKAFKNIKGGDLAIK